MPHSKKSSNNFIVKTIHTFWEFFMFVCQVIEKCILVLQFTKFQSLSIPSTRYVTGGASYLSQSLLIRKCKICVMCMQGLLVTQTQQFHLHTLVELKFSSFSSAELAFAKLKIHLLFCHCGSLTFILGEIYSLLHSLIKISSQ